MCENTIHRMEPMVQGHNKQQMSNEEIHETNYVQRLTNWKLYRSSSTKV